MVRHKKTQYIPGMYYPRRRAYGTASMMEQFMRDWERRKMDAKKRLLEKKTGQKRLHCYICFSRKIGVGALEIADIVGKDLGYPVIDRQIIEHIAQDKAIQSEVLSDFDERYPGMTSEFASLLLCSFTKVDFMRHMIAAVTKMAEMGPTIFVGRGIHLILPRDRVLAVRIISSRERRIMRVARIMSISEEEAAKHIDREDKLQRDFFKKNFGKKDASPYEFDLVINRDYITDLDMAAELVETAFSLKYGEGSVKKEQTKE